MRLNSQERLLNRVVKAAEAALADHSFVSAIDVLCGMRLLAPTHVEAWRKGRVDFLERVIQGNLHKISRYPAVILVVCPLAAVRWRFFVRLKAQITSGGTWMRSSFGSTANSSIYGEPWIRTAT